MEASKIKQEVDAECCRIKVGRVTLFLWDWPRNNVYYSFSAFNVIGNLTKIIHFGLKQAVSKSGRKHPISENCSHTEAWEHYTKGAELNQCSL